MMISFCTSLRIVSASPVIVALLVFSTPGQASGRQIGPESGTLVIAGGGSMQDTGIVERFLDLSGGVDALVVFIPTAAGAQSYDQEWSGADVFRDAGATNIVVLHTSSREEADSDIFVQPIREAGGVWFGGGRQWRLADSYLDTKVHEELWALLGRGGVIGGTSAGATIQGSYLARGDTRTNTVMMGDHEEGLAFLKNVAIDQHLLVANRQFDLLQIVREHPELLGIGIDESTAIVVQRDRFEVIGRSYVVIYDHGASIDSGGEFYFLGAGDQYNLASREAFRRGQHLRRVARRPWSEK